LHREQFDNPVRFGSESYSKEELVAELGSSMLCGVSGISPRVLDNSAAYLQSWINKLRGDFRMIISAASAAQKASDFILGTSAKVADESEAA
jgi:antirestriction protein ArdC